MHYRRRKTIARFTYVASFVGVALVLGLVSTVITAWSNNELEAINPFIQDDLCKYKELY